MHEIRIRVTSSLYEAITLAAAKRSTPVNGFMATLAYEYLRERGELGATPAPAKPAPFVADMSVWLDDDDEPLNVGS